MDGEESYERKIFIWASMNDIKDLAHAERIFIEEDIYEFDSYTSSVLSFHFLNETDIH